MACTRTALKVDPAPADPAPADPARAVTAVSRYPVRPVPATAWISWRTSTAAQRSANSAPSRPICAAVRDCDDAVAELRTALIWIELARAERSTGALDAPDVPWAVEPASSDPPTRLLAEGRQSGGRRDPPVVPGGSLWELSTVTWRCDVTDSMKDAWSDVADGFSKLGSAMKDRYRTGAVADDDAPAGGEPDAGAERLREALERLRRRRAATSASGRSTSSATRKLMRRPDAPRCRSTMPWRRRSR